METKELVDRFLRWTLPIDFSPDCFVNFDREAATFPSSWPMGTNLLNAQQAAAMVSFMLGNQKSNLDFGQALRALKSGQRVARAGWNGKGMWLSLSGNAGGSIVHYSDFWSTNNATFAASQPDESAVVLPSITMKTADDKILMGWLASQTDMLADDWMIVE